MKYVYLIVFFLLSCLSITGCSDDNDDDHSPTGPSSSTAPPGHTVNRDGVFHGGGPIPGSCTGCHGIDLRGGSVGVSCYQCHGNEWDDDD